MPLFRSSYLILYVASLLSALGQYLPLHSKGIYVEDHGSVISYTHPLSVEPWAELQTLGCGCSSPVLLVEDIQEALGVTSEKGCDLSHRDMTVFEV